MKTLLLSLLIGLAVFSSAFGQERTDEKKWTIDPETGDTIYTEAVVISQSEDITPRNNLIIINPLKFLLFYNISYFHKLGEGICTWLWSPDAYNIRSKWIRLKCGSKILSNGKKFAGILFSSKYFIQ